MAATFFREVLTGERSLGELADGLTSRKYDANLVFATKSTPLHMAAALGSVEGTALLLRHGADSLSFDGANRSALAIACAHGNVAVAQLILDDLKPKHASVLMSMIDDKGWTVLHYAALGGAVGVVDLLVQKGLVDALRSRPPAATGAQTPLHLAAAKGDAAMCAAVCAHLPELISALCAEGKRDALMLASAEGHCEAVGALLAAKGDVHARDDDGWTALHWAAAMEHPRSCAALLAAGADPESRCNAGKPMPPIAPVPSNETATRSVSRLEPLCKRLVCLRLQACGPASIAVRLGVVPGAAVGRPVEL